MCDSPRNQADTVAPYREAAALVLAQATRLPEPLEPESVRDWLHTNFVDALLRSQRQAGDTSPALAELVEVLFIIHDSFEFFTAWHNLFRAYWRQEQPEVSVLHRAHLFGIPLVVPITEGLAAAMRDCALPAAGPQEARLP